jgi:predicted small integral membrane protein
MMIRTAKMLLLSSVAFFYTLVIFNNLTDYGSNAQFVRHVLLMDTTIPGNRGMWRSISSPAVDIVFYVAIICWESVTAVLLWWGVARLWRARRSGATFFNAAKSIAVLGLTLSLLMWLVAFVSVGGEWFLMWQSKVWSGEETAFRDFTMIAIVFLLLIHPDTETQA